MKRFTIKKLEGLKGLITYTVLIDDEDAHYLRNYVWSIRVHKRGTNGVMLHRMVAQEDVYLHKLISGASADEKVRFIDGNEQNMQKANMIKMSRVNWFAWLHNSNSVKSVLKRV